MPIKRCSEQKRCTLEEFYIELSETSANAYVDVGKAMLAFVDLINDTFKETLIWGLTSHARLILQTKDDSAADSLVVISNIGTKEYYFEYLIPADKRPWKYAYVRGEAYSLAEAKKYLLIAMRESEGWIDNAELRQLLIENGLELK
ncbi:hypothetical protein [Spirosoma litoris]